MFTQTWHGNKSPITTNHTRSLTPKTGLSRKEEKTPEKNAIDYSQLLNYTPSPHFNHPKSPGFSQTLTPKTLRKMNELSATPDKDKSLTFIKENQKHTYLMPH